eukprot:Sspe_Gene.98108::Locus_71564_Transcript_1_1_Confidence_1.000_Length_937::g.98108::m.98108
MRGLVLLLLVQAATAWWAKSACYDKSCLVSTSISLTVDFNERVTVESMEYKAVSSGFCTSSQGTVEFSVSCWDQSNSGLRVTSLPGGTYTVEYGTLYSHKFSNHMCTSVKYEITNKNSWCDLKLGSVRLWVSSPPTPAPWTPTPHRRTPSPPRWTPSPPQRTPSNPSYRAQACGDAVCRDLTTIEVGKCIEVKDVCHGNRVISWGRCTRDSNRALHCVTFDDRQCTREVQSFYMECDRCTTVGN